MKIYQKLGNGNAIVKDIADSSIEDFSACDTLIFGVSTWGIGEIQEDWKDFLAGLKQPDLNGKRVAIFCKMRYCSRT